MYKCIFRTFELQGLYKCSTFISEANILNSAKNWRERPNAMKLGGPGGCVGLCSVRGREKCGWWLKMLWAFHFLSCSFLKQSLNEHSLIWTCKHTSRPLLFPVIHSNFPFYWLVVQNSQVTLLFHGRAVVFNHFGVTYLWETYELAWYFT